MAGSGHSTCRPVPGRARAGRAPRAPASAVTSRRRRGRGRVTVARLLHRLGMFSARRPLVMIGIWVLLGVGSSARSRRSAPRPTTTSPCPAPTARRPRTCWQERFPPQQNGATRSSSHVSTGKLTDEAHQAGGRRSVKAIKAARTSTASPTRSAAPGRRPACCRRTARRVRPGPARHRLRRPHDRARAARPGRDGTGGTEAGITVAAAGSIGSTLSPTPSETSELVGIIAAMVILTLRARQPGGDGDADPHRRRGADVGARVIGLVGHIVTIPSSGPTLATMIGLGVGIDYALFLITRHQEAPGRRHGDRRLDRPCGGDVGQRDRLRRLHGRDRAAVPRRSPASRWSARSGYASAIARRRRGARRDHACCRPSSACSAPDRLAGAAGVPEPGPDSRGTGHVGTAGPASYAGTRGGHRAVAGRPGPADHPGVLARARPGGHRRHRSRDHRAPGLRPDHRRLRRRATTGRSRSPRTEAGRRRRARSTLEVRPGHSR